MVRCRIAYSLPPTRRNSWACAICRLRFAEPSPEPLRTLSDYDQRVVRMRQRGLTYPYEIVRLMTPEHAGPTAEIPAGSFVELDRFVTHRCTDFGLDRQRIIDAVFPASPFLDSYLHADHWAYTTDGVIHYAA